MPLDPLPALDRTSATFKTDLDSFFLTDLPAFSVQAKALRVEVVASEASAANSADTATTQAGIATNQVALTTADAVATAEDRVQTGLDRTQTGLDRIAAAASAAAAAGTAAFVDTNPVVKGSVDATKQIRFEVDGLTTATTRVLTVPDKDGTVAMTSDITDERSAAASLTNKTITETVYAVTGTTPALAATNGAVQTWTLTANSTPTSSLTSGQSIVLGILDGTAYSVTWPSVMWSKQGGSGAAPSLNATLTTWVVLWKVGSTLYGAYLGDA